MGPAFSLDRDGLMMLSVAPLPKVPRTLEGNLTFLSHQRQCLSTGTEQAPLGPRCSGLGQPLRSNGVWNCQEVLGALGKFPCTKASLALLIIFLL